ncbi:lipase family protein [Methylosarcina fibrata]|uniref:acetyltransferase n=1 Tax=Methylosarcina fibrata TaxID=105972 RepID=UPI00039E91E7|nr:acetyltransferase [Methylosarcina fibrata]
MENIKAKLARIEQNSEAIILLHGLARTGRSMKNAGRLFSEYGYQIITIDYPSRHYGIERLALDYIEEGVRKCEPLPINRIHFFTHSLGGILLRYYLSRQRIDKLGRAVMLAPPNQGSEIVDKLGAWKLFKYFGGPAGLQLGTKADSLPNSLGSVHFPVGVIAGDKPVNPFLSRLISGANDGKVSVERCRVEGMQDFLVVPFSHTFIMQRDYIIEQSLHFIQHGFFWHEKGAD